MSHAKLSIAVAASLLFAGCFAPDVPDGALLCSVGEEKCPTGFHCAADKTCWHNGSDPDLAATAVDLSEPRSDLGPDLSPIDDGGMPHDLAPDLAMPDLIANLCSNVTCTAMDQCHDVGVCNLATGVCSNPVKSDGSTCSDGNACTTGDSCQSGACVAGTPVVCTASDQCHLAGVCNTGTGQCSNPNKANGSTCDDGNMCTQVDSCQAGVCTGATPVVCSASDQCHSVGTCDPSTGTCSNPNKPDGTTCSDSNACTQTDTCQAGFCVGGNPVVCTASDQCHVAGTCAPATGVCSNPNASNGTACTDGNPCTLSDSCQNGSCQSGAPKVCTALDQCHTAGTCDTSTGLCSNPSKSDGTACNDGNLCTQTDTCQTGVCTGSNPVVCSALDQCHNVGTCAPATGTCSNPNKADGTGCSDGNACTQTDTCQGGTCVGTNPVVCMPQDQCHVAGTCAPGSGLCSNPNAPNGSACSDGNPCTLNDTCQTGACQAGSPKTCTPLDQCHNAGTCDVVSGNCSNPAKANGAACSDGNFCTQTDTCQSGICTGGNPVVCTALDQCHAVGTCDTTTGVCNNPNAPDGTSCNDGNVCTSTDVCTNGTCAGSPLPEFVDQSMTTFNIGFAQPTPFWQEFVPSTKGTLTKIGIFKNGLSGSQTVTVNVYAGGGLGGTRIYTGSVTLPNVSAEVTVVLPGTGPTLAAGNHYTFQFVDPSNTLGVLAKSGNPYPAGASGAGVDGGGVGYDYWFKTYMLPICP
jgi:hypothetical protein